MNEIKEKYLPIGTVVLLKGAKKRIMIIGFCIVPENDKNKMYDYLGCIYPEGSYDPKQGLMFNHDQIEKIYHMGLIDEEEENFKSKMNDLLLKESLEDSKKDNNGIKITKLEE